MKPGQAQALFTRRATYIGGNVNEVVPIRNPQPSRRKARQTLQGETIKRLPVRRRVIPVP